MSSLHEWDDDACCIYCGFDGAEWWHWKHNTYEGRASGTKQPLCTKPRTASFELRARNAVPKTGNRRP